MSSISPLARRIARAHNRDLPPHELRKAGGFMVFDREGTLLRTIAQDHFDTGPGVLLHKIRADRVKLIQVQAWLDALA